MDPCRIFAGSASRHLAVAICETLKVPVGDIEVSLLSATAGRVYADHNGSLYRLTSAAPPALLTIDGSFLDARGDRLLSVRTAFTSLPPQLHKSNETRTRRDVELV